MNTKTCKCCGWVYPRKTPYESCIFCGTRFTEGYCKVCGVEIDELINNAFLCKECYEKGQKHRLLYLDLAPKNDGLSSIARHRKKRREQSTTVYNEWVERMSKVKMHTLTEDEWLEACRYFNGCAMCDSESIEARGYFIPFDEGGKYNACNVIPLCEKCATEYKRQRNPLVRMDKQLNSSLASSRGLSLDKVYKVMEYLQSKIGENEDE